MPLLRPKQREPGLLIAVAMVSMASLIGLVATSTAGPPTATMLPPAAKQTIDFGRNIEPVGEDAATGFIAGVSIG